MEIVSIVTLSISGLLLFVAGTSRLINPIKNYLKNSGITLEKEVNILNEARAVGSVMMLSGVIMLLGIISSELTMTSHIIALLILFGFAIGRAYSMAIDGKPNKLLITGLISELVLGSINVFCLINLLVNN